uniref:Uncharacterized protein n=1 Tax=viral metagenome TaxID=1070528 RepID=A0A6M3KUZ5_9ZZZZ
MTVSDIPWLDDMEYRKAHTQMRMGAQMVFDFIKVDDKLPVRYLYGLGPHVLEGIEEICRR